MSLEKVKQKYPNRKIDTIESRLKDGHLHKTYQIHYENDVKFIEFIENYVDEKLQRVRAFYKLSDPDKRFEIAQGQICKLDEEYQHDQLHGYRKTYYDSVYLELEENYEHGQLHGSRMIYKNYGYLELKENYEHGKLHGHRQKWRVDGYPEFKETYDNGNCTFKVTCDHGKLYG